MITHPSFGRAKGKVVLDAEATEDLHPAIVHAHGHRDCQGPLGVFDAVAVVGADFKEVGHAVELRAGHIESGVTVNVHISGKEGRSVFCWYRAIGKIPKRKSRHFE